MHRNLMSFGSRAPFGAAGGTETLSQTPRTVAGKRWDKGIMERGEGEQGEKGGRGRTLKQRREGEKAPKRCTHISFQLGAPVSGFRSH